MPTHNFIDLTGQVGVIYRNGIFTLAGQKEPYTKMPQGDLIYHEGTCGLVTTLVVAENTWSLE